MSKLCSIIILNFNGEVLLRNCLPSVVRSARFNGGKHEVVVLDNASTDGSVALVRSEFPSVIVKEMPENRFLFSYND